MSCGVMGVALMREASRALQSEAGSHASRVVLALYEGPHAFRTASNLSTEPRGSVLQLHRCNRALVLPFYPMPKAPPLAAVDLRGRLPSVNVPTGKLTLLLRAQPPLSQGACLHPSPPAANNVVQHGHVAGFAHVAAAPRTQHAGACEAPGSGAAMAGAAMGGPSGPTPMSAEAHFPRVGWILRMFMTEI